MWVVLMRACKNLGINYARQLSKLKGKPWATVSVKDTVAADGKAREMVCLHLDCVPMWLAKLKKKPWATTADTTVVAADGKAREMTCLLLDCVPMWLATIETGKVKTVGNRPHHEDGCGGRGGVGSYIHYGYNWSRRQAVRDGLPAPRLRPDVAGPETCLP